MVGVNLKERNWNDRNLWSTTTRGTMKMEADKQQQRNFNNKNSSPVNRATRKSDSLKEGAFINDNINCGSYR
jgi:hypothetical protein